MKFEYLKFKREGLSQETLSHIDVIVAELRKKLDNDINVEAEVSASRDKITIKISKKS